ncbi:alanine acetyltransferase [Alteromonas sp. BMJM2]|uniref:alanine acetyltransferase n=1 Tax=Alteromonas sp. BMJM2 TaxID=2954241 RepID=UPI0022B53820|nr:alanine acetyltransferase [Alteromonas sp. BMJM2]
MLITPYQHAVLQEMGIPVWISKKAYFAAQNSKEGNGANKNTGSENTAKLLSRENAPAPVSSKPISQQEKQSRLDQLRAHVGGATAHKESPPIKESSAAKESSATNKSQPTQSDTNSQSQPLGIPLSASQKVASAAWLSDLTLACVQLGLSSSQVNVFIGTTLSIHDDAIVLPAPPTQLSTQQKRDLWQALISTSQNSE